jgi:hypothetical protein
VVKTALIYSVVTIYLGRRSQPRINVVRNASKVPTHSDLDGAIVSK